MRKKKSLILYYPEKSQITLKGNRRSLPPDLERLKPSACTAASQRCTTHGMSARRPTAAPRQYQHDDASRDHASVTVTPCRLFACSIALGSNSSIFLSLSNAVSCGLKMFWNVLKCILLCKFVVVVCHVCCAAAYFTKVFVFYFLSFFLIELSLLFTLFLTEYIVICVSAVLTVLLCVRRFILYLFETLNVVLLSFLRFWILCC